MVSDAFVQNESVRKFLLVDNRVEEKGGFEEILSCCCSYS